MHGKFWTLAASTALAPALAWAISTGDAIPMKDTRMLSVDGRDVSIGEVAGEKGTLVVFTCNHCPYARAWEDRIVALGNEYAGRGIGVIAINPNDPTMTAEDDFEHMQQRAREKKFGFPYVVDSTSGVARAFGATHTPEIFLFDKGGTLAYHGAVDDNSADPGAVQSHYLKDALDAVIAGKIATPAETKALGCSIKFR